MKTLSIKPLLTITTCILCSNAFAATNFAYLSGDDIQGSGTIGLTGASFSQVIAGTGLTIDSSYTGAFSDTRAGTNAFYNDALGAIPASTRFSSSFVASGGDIKITSSDGPADDYEITTVGANVTSITLTFSYLGQFDSSGVLLYNEGMAGRWSFPLSTGTGPDTNLRGFTLRNLEPTPGGEVLKFVMSATEFSGSAATVVATDFYKGEFEEGDWIDPTVLGVTAEGAFDGNEGMYFHNGSNMDEMLSEVTFVITAEGGGPIADDTTFRFTFDAMTHSVNPVPEPSSAAMLVLGLSFVIGYRKRS